MHIGFIIYRLQVKFMKKKYTIKLLCGSVFSLLLSFSANAMESYEDFFSCFDSIKSTNPSFLDDDYDWEIPEKYNVPSEQEPKRPVSERTLSSDDNEQSLWREWGLECLDTAELNDKNFFSIHFSEAPSQKDELNFLLSPALEDSSKRKANDKLGGDTKRRKIDAEISPELKVLNHIRSGEEDQVLILLKSLDLSIFDSPSLESFCLLAAEKGLLRVIQYLSENRPDLLLAAKDSKGATCLHLACMYGKTDIVHYLMTHQNSLFNSKTSVGLTPLNYCICYGQRTIFDYYLKNYDPSFFFQSQNSHSPIQYAMSSHRYDFVIDIINKAIEVYGLTTFYECNEFIIDSIHSSILEYISKKYNLTALDNSFLTVIMCIAPFSGQPDLIKTICYLFPDLKENLKNAFKLIYKLYRENTLVNSLEQQSYFLNNLIENNVLLGVLTEGELNEFKKSIDTKNFHNKTDLFSTSNHHSLIKNVRAGRLGKDVNVVVCDGFLSPPKGSGMIMYNSQLDKKIPTHYRNNDLITRSVINSTEYGTHGVSVSGTIADDVSGISSNANLIPIHGCFFEEIIQNNFNSKVINISLDLGEDQMSIVGELCKNNIVVISAGNDGRTIHEKYSKLLQSSEDARKHLFLVSNVMKDGITLNPMSSYFSEPGKKNPLVESVGIAAPGTEIVTSIPGNGIYSYSVFSGTSFSAPIVTGAIAKLMSDFPKLSITEIADITRLGANKFGDYADQGKFGQGFLDIKTNYLLAEKYMKKQDQDFRLESPLGFEINRMNEEELQSEFESIKYLWNS